MCGNHPELETVTENVIKVKDISQAVIDMPYPRGFLESCEEFGVKPRFANSIKALYLLMHWPLINEEDSKIDEATGTSFTGISLYAAVLEHGKTHVAEIFFANEKTKSYQGTHKVFSLEFPENKYDEGYDDWLMNELANNVLGVKMERSLGHDIPIRKDE